MPSPYGRAYTIVCKPTYRILPGDEHGSPLTSWRRSTMAGDVKKPASGDKPKFRRRKPSVRCRNTVGSLVRPAYYAAMVILWRSSTTALPPQRPQQICAGPQRLGAACGFRSGVGHHAHSPSSVSPHGAEIPAAVQTDEVPFQLSFHSALLVYQSSQCEMGVRSGLWATLQNKTLRSG